MARRSRSPASHCSPTPCDVLSLVSGAAATFVPTTTGARARSNCSACFRNKPLPPAPSPGGLPRAPKLVEQWLFADGVHRLPVAGMLVTRQLSLSGQALHRLPLEHGLIGFQVVEDLRGHDEIPAVDPAVVADRLLREADDAIAVEDELAKAGHRAYPGDQHRSPRLAGGCQQRPEVGVADAGALGQH